MPVSPINEEVYTKMASQVEEMQEKLIAAKDLRDAMREAGQDTTDTDAKILEIEKAIKSWTGVLKRRGYLD